MLPLLFHLLCESIPRIELVVVVVVVVVGDVDKLFEKGFGCMGLNLFVGKVYDLLNEKNDLLKSNWEVWAARVKNSIVILYMLYVIYMCVCVQTLFLSSLSPST